jgi:predicted CXXCH cytochrome family protein
MAGRFLHAAHGLFIAVLAAQVTLAAQLQVSSPTNKHNLSTSGPGPVRASETTEICIFCHTPHNADPSPPLWNQALSVGVTYRPYSSTTMAASPGAPTGSSKLCLSCHDGTIAIGTTLSRGRIAVEGVDGSGRLTGTSVLGTNLSDDHPISFVPVTGPQIVMPPAGDPVQLDRHGMLQCRSCHDPHVQDADPVVKKFLVTSNSSSELCLTCHQKTYWATNPSSHRTSIRSYTTANGAHTGYTTVATNACESCHKPHTGAAATRMLKGVEENTCGTGAGAQCHGPSSVARWNIVAEFNKTYRHPTYSITPSGHDASESPTNGSHRLPEASSTVPRHAECADCHNAHATYAATATAPKASGRLAGVWGIDSNGLVVQPSGTPASVREYEICYKCHADSANKAQPAGPSPPYPNRQAPQFNKRLQFDPANPSYHPVEAPGRNLSVPSLVAPWTTSSVVYCTDCHDNDTGPKAPTPGGGPAGPHGSNYKHLLAGRYDMDNSQQAESPATYALCYKCHSRSSILSDVSFKEHSRHLAAGAPCSICHDPHGVSAGQGNSSNNSHLINFDLRFVTPSRSGLLRFEDLGTNSGRCFLTCHAREHDPREY